MYTDYAGSIEELKHAAMNNKHSKLSELHTHKTIKTRPMGYCF